MATRIILKMKLYPRSHVSAKQNYSYGPRNNGQSSHLAISNNIVSLSSSSLIFPAFSYSLSRSPPLCDITKHGYIISCYNYKIHLNLNTRVEYVFICGPLPSAANWRKFNAQLNNLWLKWHYKLIFWLYLFFIECVIGIYRKKERDAREMHIRHFLYAH